MPKWFLQVKRKPDISTYEEVAERDGAVGIYDEAVSTQRRRVFELGRDEHADGGEQLEL